MVFNRLLYYLTSESTSMSGLMTRRLSGAPQKRLTRERKMRDGTWTVQKPPGKTPSSLVKGVVEGRGSLFSDLPISHMMTLYPHLPGNWRSW
jgi:hypothetical protein